MREIEVKQRIQIPISRRYADMNEFVREVQQRIEDMEAKDPAKQNSRFKSSAVDLSILREHARRLAEDSEKLGSVPPGPPTFRARAGAFFIRIVRRALFWYTPQIVSFHRQVSTTFEENAAALAEVAARVERVAVESVALTVGADSAQSVIQQCLSDAAGLRRRVDSQAAGQADLLTRVEQVRALCEALSQSLGKLERAALDESMNLTKRLDDIEKPGRVAVQVQLQDLANRLNRIETGKSSGVPIETRVNELERALINARRDGAAQSRRLSVLLEEVRKRTPDGSSTRLSDALVAEDAHKLDALYVSFEDEFRGTREEIKDRLRIYIPMIREFEAGTDAAPVIDIGSGRGEWLELLAEEGLVGKGIDINRILVEEVRQRGYQVCEGDAIERLRQMRDNSAGAITGFHIVEHLPLETLIQLLDETVRVLNPNGLAIFETPNPGNLLVGAHNFYLDPTHRNPLPSATLQFLAEARGLCQVRILLLHPCPAGVRLKDNGSEIADRLNDLLYGSQDYAVIGRKAHG